MAAVKLEKEVWSSRFAFLMASVGFAVGLGNIWRFPYVAGENGGGAFVVVYLICVLLIGVPVLMAELLIGRRGQSSPPIAVANIAKENGKSGSWKWVGGLGLVAAYTIEIIYSVIVGWVLWYLFKAATTGFDGVDATIANANFEGMLRDSSIMITATFIGLAITGSVIYAGVQSGIEKAVRFMMPLLFLLLVGLATYNYFATSFYEAMSWLFTPDFSKIDGSTLLAAIGQAFFSIGVAMGGMMAYGAYLPRSVSIGRSAFIIVAADTVVAILAGLVIFPAVFKYGLDPAAGAGLIFKTLPVAFAQMPNGHLFSTLFFLMLAVAGITSMVGLIESVTAWVEEKFNISRQLSAILVVGSLSLLSLVSIFSYNIWADWSLAGNNFNDLMDFFSNQLLLPLGGLLIAVFAGWVMNREGSRIELSALGEGVYSLWHFLIRFVVPPVVALILITGLLG